MTSYNFKVVLLGQGCVGKTSLVLRYVSNVFNDSHQSTLQASFLKKQLYLEQNLVRLNIWDTAGQEKFHALGPIYYREAHGALLVYDVTNADSLRKVRDWIKELNRMLGTQKVCLAIVGNKLDLLTGQSGNSTTGSNNNNNYQLVDGMSGANGKVSFAITSNKLIQEAQEMADELTNARHYLISAKLAQGINELFASLSKRMIEQHERTRHKHSERLASSSRFVLARTISLAPDERNQQQQSGDDAKVVDRLAGGTISKSNNGGACHC